MRCYVIWSSLEHHRVHPHKPMVLPTTVIVRAIYFCKTGSSVSLFILTEHHHKHKSNPAVNPTFGFSFCNARAWLKLWLWRHPFQGRLSQINTLPGTELDKEPGLLPLGGSFVLGILANFNNWPFGLLVLFSRDTLNSCFYVLNLPIKPAKP